MTDTILINDIPFEIETEGMLHSNLDDNRFVVTSVTKSYREIFVNYDDSLSDGNMISGISIKIPSKRDEISHKIRQYDSASNSVTNLQLKFIKAPMPGLVKSVLVTQGQTVSKDSPILILEAMKMENSIKAGYSGIIKEVITEVGKNVEKNEILLKIEV